MTPKLLPDLKSPKVTAQSVIDVYPLVLTFVTVLRLMNQLTETILWPGWERDVFIWINSRKCPFRQGSRRTRRADILGRQGPAEMPGAGSDPEGQVEIQLSLRLSVSQTTTDRHHYSHT